MPTNQTTISVNYATPKVLVGAGIEGGIGTVSVDLDADFLTYHYDDQKKYILINKATVVNEAAGIEGTPKTIKFLKDGYKLLFAGATTVSGGAFTEKTTVSDMLSSLYLAFWEPKELTSASTARIVPRLYASDISSMFNLGNSTGWTQLGLMLTYTKGAATAYAYKQLTIPPLTWEKVELKRKAYSVFTGGNTLTLSDGYEEGGIITPMGGLGTREGEATSSCYKSSTIGIPTDSVVGYFGIPIGDITPSSTITITPFMFVGACDGTYMGSLQNINGESALSVSMTVPATFNTSTITISNTDSTNNKDEYSDGYGWIGTYNPGSVSDSSITVTIAAGT